MITGPLYKSGPKELKVILRLENSDLWSAYFQQPSYEILNTYFLVPVWIPFSYTLVFVAGCIIALCVETLPWPQLKPLDHYMFQTLHPHRNLKYTFFSTLTTICEKSVISHSPTKDSCICLSVWVCAKVLWVTDRFSQPEERDWYSTLQAPTFVFDYSKNIMNIVRKNCFKELERLFSPLRIWKK